MTRTLSAVYENGVLRPLEPLPFRDHQRVTVTVTESPVEAAENWLDHAYLASLEPDDEPEPSLEQVRKLLAKVPGKLSDDVRAEREDWWLPSSYLDTSALSKLYHQGPGTRFIESLLLQTSHVLLISRLGVLEMESVLAGKVRTGALAEHEVAIARRRFRSDLRRRRINVIAVAAGHFREAEKLIQVHGATHGLRTLDAVQLSVALDLHRNHLLDDFIAADHTFCRVASAEGLPVVDPETADALA